MSLNVAVVVLDTTRARETVPADPELTPTLASLADEGLAYTRAFSTAPWTLPAHGSLFTGTYPSTHGAHSDSEFLGEQLATLPELYREAGYETVGMSNNTWIAEEFGFARGFETFHGPTERPPSMQSRDGPLDRLRDAVPSPSLPWGRLRRLHQTFHDRFLAAADDGAGATVTRIRQWLADREGDDPFFLFVNCIEPHLEYRPPRAYADEHLPDGWTFDEAMAIPQNPREYDAGLFSLSADEWGALRGLYRAEIAYLDHQVGRIRSLLRSAGVWDDTVFVVVGDHGENVGEYDLLGHQYCLYDTLVHVPLVACGGPFDHASSCDDLVQLTDLAPTLLDATHVDAPSARDQFQGESALPDAGGQPRSHVYAEYFAPQPGIERLEERFGDLPDRIHRFQRSLRAVRTDRYKYVRGSDGSEQLYDLEADRAELSDLAAERPDLRRDLASRLQEWRSSLDRADPQDSRSISQAARQQLADLGYR